MDSAELKQLDPQRLSTWYAEHADRLRAFVRGILRDSTLADEVVQTTFAQALAQGAGVRVGAEKAWLFQVAYHESMAIRRREGIHQRSLQKLSLAKHDSQRPDQACLTSEETHRVRRALDDLPEVQRQVVMARMYEEQTFQEIADQLGIPLGTVLTRMRLALKKLHQVLQEKQ